MAYSREQALELHKDFEENVKNWEYYIRSYNGGYDYMIDQYLNSLLVLSESICRQNDRFFESLLLQEFHYTHSQRIQLNQLCQDINNLFNEAQVKILYEKEIKKCISSKQTIDILTNHIKNYDWRL